ncbi:hypothetical protein Moror_5774 [Moniliophthora roreri MCA 2997]|uniref:Uncharacterized protein n=1 Tax=Moniliophthora roreri (strain MCA 2997) TaxID=1381753 RepID=V2WKC4_MONRO|nr:hypothetical protein Moror_5774 [Moniliophthora roreri MCA 2997]
MTSTSPVIVPSGEDTIRGPETLKMNISQRFATNALTIMKAVVRGILIRTPFQCLRAFRHEARPLQHTHIDTPPVPIRQHRGFHLLSLEQDTELEQMPARSPHINFKDTHALTKKTVFSNLGGRSVAFGRKELELIECILCRDTSVGGGLGYRKWRIRSSGDGAEEGGGYGGIG